MTDAETSDHSKSIDYDSVLKVYDQVRSGTPQMVHEILNGVFVNEGSLIPVFSLSKPLYPENLLLVSCARFILLNPLSSSH